MIPLLTAALLSIVPHDVVWLLIQAVAIVGLVLFGAATLGRWVKFTCRCETCKAWRKANLPQCAEKDWYT